MVKAVLFDMDGTLLDTEKYLTKFWRQAARENGVNMTVEDSCALRSFASRYASVWFGERFGKTADYWKVRERRKELMKQHLEAHPVEKKYGADEALTRLRAMGFRLAVVTATDEERTRQYLSEAGLISYFDELVCATMVERGKPYPDVYLYACERMGLRPEECLAVEDAPNGVRSASAAGCRVIMVPDLTGADGDIRELIEAEAERLDKIPELCYNLKMREGAEYGL